MAKHYPRERYPSGVVAGTDAITALMEQTNMSPVQATLAVSGNMSEAELRGFGLTKQMIGQLAVASVLNENANRDRKRK